ncbi:diguanylate cyclase [Marinobacter fonticola]|uniref:diguanylate cyclase n=1 Tax=Marinobacter fonticola TaxID=2603215 RepID=UPI0011E60CBB|nr:diguanylate cyclase [Marinobacter fonticola]
MSASDVQGQLDTFQLDTLRDQFANRVTSELDELVQLLGRPMASDGGQRARSALQILQSMGSGARTFGYFTLGCKVRSLELALQAVVDANDANGWDTSSAALGDTFLEHIQGLADLLEPELPARVADIAVSTHPSDDVNEQPSVPMIEPSRVVLLEPDDDAARLLADHLQQRGYLVHRLADTAGLDDIAAQVGSSVPATLVADASFGHRLAELPVVQSGAFLPAIYLSSMDSFELRYLLAQTGAAGFFPRPVDIPLLVGRIERQMAGARETRRGRVLVMAGDAEAGVRYRRALQSADLEVATLSNPRDCLPRLAEFRPDIVLTESRVGAYSSTVLARMIRLQPEWLELPVIHLTPEDADEPALASITDLDDLIVTPIADRQLATGVRARCKRARQLSLAKSRDGLTGLLNARAIRRELANEYARARRNGHDAVLAMIDLDEFQAVNDIHGHVLGDTVMRALAELLARRLRSTDIVGRYDSDAFVAVLPDCSGPDAWGLLDAVGQQLSEHEFESDTGTFRVSLRVSMAQLGTFPSAEAALAAADKALDSHQGVDSPQGGNRSVGGQNAGNDELFFSEAQLF